MHRRLLARFVRSFVMVLGSANLDRPLKTHQREGHDSGNADGSPGANLLAHGI